MLGELGAQCLPYPENETPIGDVVTWFEGEVKSLLGTFAQANKNFACFATAGVLRLLQEFSCEHLLRLHPLAGSSDVSLLIPTEVQKLAGRLVRKWWSEHRPARSLRRDPEVVSFKTCKPSTLRFTLFDLLLYDLLCLC
jgi:hypothetical protein